VARWDPVRAAATREVGAVGLAAEPPPHRFLSCDSTGLQLAAPNSTAASAGGPSRSPASLVALCLGELPWASVSLAWSPALSEGVVRSTPQCFSALGSKNCTNPVPGQRHACAYDSKRQTDLSDEVGLALLRTVIWIIPAILALCVALWDKCAVLFPPGQLQERALAPSPHHEAAGGSWRAERTFELLLPNWCRLV
jgi:hypothetical protein